MTTTTQQAEQPRHLVEVLKDFDSAILVTRTESGELRGRPMTFAKLEAGGDIFFACSLSTETAREIEADPRVAVTVQGKVKFASVSGRAHLTRDRALIKQLWREGWKLWFPEGPDDPNLCLIKFDADEGEYWDNSGSRGIKFALRAASAYVRGDRLDERDASQNAKVKLH